MKDKLNTEIETYNSKLPELIASAGKFVVIRGQDIAGTFDTYNDGLKFAYHQFGLEPFLIKKISPAEQVSFFTRNLESCQA